MDAMRILKCISKDFKITFKIILIKSQINLKENIEGSNRMRKFKNTNEKNKVETLNTNRI